MKRRLLRIVFLMVIAAAMLLCTGVSASDSGTIGSSLTWTLSDDGTLTISGKGAVSTVPWKSKAGEIKAVVVESGVTYLTNSAFSGCVNLTSVSLPESLVSIGTSVFSGCTSLTSVVLPSGLKTLETATFRDCKGLSSVTLPAGLSAIGGNAFSGCTALASVGIPSGVTSIGDSAFSGCISLTSAELPAGLTSLGDYAFYTCASLASVKLPAGITSVGKSAFSDCSVLASVELPSGLTAIGERAFQNCVGLQEIELPEGLLRIGKYAFNNSGLIRIDMPDSLTEAGEGAFYKCAQLEAFTTGEGLTAISKNMFAHCTSLVSGLIQTGVKSIGDQAFQGCSSVTAFDLRDSYMTEIGPSAFSDCEKLTIIRLPESLQSIAYAAFSDDPALLRVDIPAAVTTLPAASSTSLTIRSPKAVLMVKIDSEAERYAAGNKLLYIAWGVDEDRMLTLRGNTATPDFTADDRPWQEELEKIEQVKVDSGVTGLGDYSLCGLTAARCIVIGDTVTDIGDSAMADCTALSTVRLPEGLAVIGPKAFWSDASLDLITIPSGVTDVGESALGNAEGRTAVYVGRDRDSWEAAGGANAGISGNTTVHYCDFDIKQDAWGFCNSKSGFGYGSSYAYPEERFRTVFGSAYVAAAKSAGGETFHSMMPEFSGNCYGMSAAAILLYSGKLDWDSYRNGSNYASVNRDHTGNNRKNADGYYYVATDSKYKAVRLIETYHLLQLGTAGGYKVDAGTAPLVEQEFVSVPQAPDANGSYKVKHLPNGAYIQHVLDFIVTKDEPLMCSFSDYMHNIVIPNSSAPEAMGDGWYRVPVYDPNNPYSDQLEFYRTTQEYTLSQYYLNAIEEGRYLELNPEKNLWRYIGSVSSDGTRGNYRGTTAAGGIIMLASEGYENGRKYTVSNPEFLNVYSILTENYPTSFDGTEPWVEKWEADLEKRKLSVDYTDDGNFTIKRSRWYGSELIAKVENGKTTHAKGGFFAGSDEDAETDGIQRLRVPYEDGLQIELESGDVTLLADELVLNLEFSGRASVCIDSAGEGLLTVNSLDANDVRIQVTRVHGPESYSSVNLQGHMDVMDSCRIAFGGGTAEVETDLDESGSLEFYVDNDTYPERDEEPAAILTGAQTIRAEDMDDGMTVEQPVAGDASSRAGNGVLHVALRDGIAAYYADISPETSALLLCAGYDEAGRMTVCRTVELGQRSGTAEIGEADFWRFFLLDRETCGPLCADVSLP